MHGRFSSRSATALFACRHCGKEFWAKRVGRPAKFCSDLCRQKAFRDAGDVTASYPSECNETPPKTAATSNPCKRVFSRSTDYCR